MSEARNNANYQFVIQLQKELGLKPDGWAGKGTIAALQLRLNQNERYIGEEHEQTKPIPPIANITDWQQWQINKNLGDRDDLDPFPKSGCLTIAACQAAQAEGSTDEPLEFSKRIDQNDGYNENSYILWDGALKALNENTGKEFTHQDTDEPFTVQRCAEYLKNGIAPILHVSGATALKSHYVTAIGIDEDGDVIIRDPGTGGSGGQKRDRLFGSLRKYTALDFKILCTTEKWEAFQEQYG